MTTLQGLAPVENPAARVLILGSMPGGVSLATGRYYAHPQNRFWSFMGELVGASPSLAYDERVEKMRDAGIALWDVIARCEREGSLDTAIRSAVANDFAVFLRAHPALRAILFNGAAAAETFRRQVPPASVPADVVQVRLPSTSPANRAVPDVDKLAKWRDALRAAGVEVVR